MCVCHCVCVSLCVCVCVSLASDSSETIEVIVNLVTVTTSDMRVHHVLIIVLTVTFMQGHTDLNHENNTCLIISETVPSNPHHVAVKIVKPKV